MSLSDTEIQQANWYALRSKPKKEFFAASLLARTGIEVYVPEWRVRKQRGQAPVVEPFFPGYFFGRLALQQVRMASYTPGIMYVLGYEPDPLPLPDTMIDTIRTRLASALFNGDHVEYHQGETVIVTSGPFRGLEALFDCQLSAKGRVRILIKTMNRLWKTEANIGQLRRVS